MISIYKLFKLLCITSFFLNGFAYAQEESGRQAPQIEKNNPPEVQEIIIEGRYPGPPLWKVSNGDNVLWIFSYLSPIPKGMIWDSDRVKEVIENSQEYLPLPQFEYSYSIKRKLLFNPNKQTLSEVLPLAYYERYYAIKAEYFPRSSGLERLRPIVVGPSIVSNLLRKNGFVDANKVVRAINKMVRRNRDMKITQIDTNSLKLRNEEGVAIAMDSLNAVTFEQELACFYFSLERVKPELSIRMERANAWAMGDVDELRYIEMDEQENNPCSMEDTSSKLWAEGIAKQVYEKWVEALEMALDTNTSTFTMISIDALLDEDGILTLLRDKGYEVREP